MKTWDHDELAADLSGHLRGPDRMVWQDMQLGPAGSPRPDVYAIYRSYARPAPTAYECKISRQDFRSDITAGKWSAYLEYANAVVFATPAGLISKDELPAMCGLIQRHETAWRIAKKPTIQPGLIAQEALLKLLIDGVRREGPVVRAKHWDRGMQEFARKFGSTAARYVNDAASVHQTIENTEFQRRKILEQAELDAKAIRERAEAAAPTKWMELTSVLGLQSSASVWDVQDAIRLVKRDAVGGAHAETLGRVLAQLQRIIENNQVNTI